MRLRSSHLAILLPALLLSACTTALPPHEALPNAARDKVATTEVVVPIHQSEVEMYVPPSTAGAAAGGGFGLIGAVVGVMVDASINSARTSAAETAIKPLRDATVDFSFDETMQSEVKTALSPLTFLGVDNVRVVKDVTSDGLDAALAKSKDGGVLFVPTYYQLSNDGDVLNVVTTASFFANNDALRALKPDTKPAHNGKPMPKTMVEKSLYHNTVSFKVVLPGSTSDRDKNIAIWSADHGAILRAELKLAAAKLAAIVAADIQRPPEDVPVKADPNDKDAYTVEGATGRVVGNDAEGVIVRFNDGTLKFVANATSAAPVPTPAPAANAASAAPAATPAATTAPVVPAAAPAAPVAGSAPAAPVAPVTNATPAAPK